MRLKDYIKDKIIYMIIYYLGIILTVIIMMLDLIIRKEKLSYRNILYAIILGSIFLILYLFLDYFKRKKFYSKLYEAFDDNSSLDDIFNIPENINKEYDFFKEVLIKNYNKYMDILEGYKKNTNIQTYFNNRWIHQMKTPISVIKLILEDEKHNELNEYTKKNHESIQEEIEKLSHGLEMALYNLRVSNFEMDFKVEDVELLEIIRSVINEYKNTFIINSIYPKLLLNEKVEVKSDKKWIKFVIGQIISNSIKYSKVKEGNDKYIYINMYRNTDRMILEIRDSGVGIANKDIKKIYDPFFTGKNGRKYAESTGMGLYLSKEVCKKLGHNIVIESIEEVETIVKIIFYDGRNIYNLS